MKDILGREVNVGDIIAYPGRQSSNLWLNVAKILAFEEKSIKVQPIPNNSSWHSRHCEGKPSRVFVVERIVKLEAL
jgi:hypothetical protein